MQVLWYRFTQKCEPTTYFGPFFSQRTDSSLDLYQLIFNSVSYLYCFGLRRHCLCVVVLEVAAAVWHWRIRWPRPAKESPFRLTRHERHGLKTHDQVLEIKRKKNTLHNLLDNTSKTQLYNDLPQQCSKVFLRLVSRAQGFLVWVIALLSKVSSGV